MDDVTTAEHAYAEAKAARDAAHRALLVADQAEAQALARLLAARRRRRRPVGIAATRLPGGLVAPGQVYLVGDAGPEELRRPA